MSETTTPKHKAIFDVCLCGASFPNAGLAREHARTAEARIAAEAVDTPEEGDEVADGGGDVIATVGSVDLGARTVVLLDARDFETTVPLDSIRRLDADIDPDRVMGWMLVGD